MPEKSHVNSSHEESFFWPLDSKKDYLELISKAKKSTLLPKVKKSRRADGISIVGQTGSCAKWDWTVHGFDSPA
eukprot:CAMPEP_0174299052 /NCGR_PEP_ID=MMETSP0809-20121228/55607_1 /TAXON_ID=73025 ORGANISM="Eutreptiella gymnastica-like, Strain CCMP1594" /NCGR_SAMPLE_ID=MMETSP0809 /ASSEMBLY_ACC=CAM_ASM_000658 /LENGTH=73 /DNA_ID=CAMNT_0015403961 /DNA_START=252 /DNA_END=470 /DNA_ORIENTATION=+